MHGKRVGHGIKISTLVFHTNFYREMQDEELKKYESQQTTQQQPWSYPSDEVKVERMR